MNFSSSVMFRSRAKVGIEVLSGLKDIDPIQGMPESQKDIEFFWCVSPDAAYKPMAELEKQAQSLAEQLAQRKIEQYFKTKEVRAPLWVPALVNYESFLVLPGQEPPQGTSVSII